MKLISAYLSAIFLFSALVYSAKLKNSQLFDAVEKSIMVQNAKSTNSLFKESPKNELKENKNINSLFPPLELNKKDDSKINSNSLFEDVHKDIKDIEKDLKDGVNEILKEAPKSLNEIKKLANIPIPNKINNKIHVEIPSQNTIEAKKVTNDKKEKKPDVKDEIENDIDEEENENEDDENEKEKTKSPIKKIENSKSKKSKKDNKKQKKENIKKEEKTDKNKKEKPNEILSDEKIESDIDKLKSQVKRLIEMNDDLVKRLDKFENKKKENKIDKNIIGFVQKYDGQVKELGTKLKNSKKTENSLLKKEKNISSLFDQTNLNFNEIKSEVIDLSDKIEEIYQKQKENEESLKNGFEGNKLTVNQNLNVRGVTYSKKVTTESINLDKVKIYDDTIKVTEETKLNIGNKSFNFGEIYNTIEFINNLQEKCGDNFENCRLISEINQREQSQNQIHIIDNLKKLRSETSRIMNKHNGPKKDKFYKR